MCGHDRFGMDNDTLQILREDFPNGTRIRCIEMCDDTHPVPSGTEGMVRLVDDMGTIHVDWDNGQTLGLIYDEDEYEKIRKSSSLYDNQNRK